MLATLPPHSHIGHINVPEIRSRQQLQKLFRLFFCNFFFGGGFKPPDIYYCCCCCWANANPRKNYILTFVSGWRRGNGGGKYEPEKPTWQKDKEAEQENARGGGGGVGYVAGPVEG